MQICLSYFYTFKNWVLCPWWQRESTSDTYIYMSVSTCCKINHNRTPSGINSALTRPQHSAGQLCHFRRGPDLGPGFGWLMAHLREPGCGHQGKLACSSHLLSSQGVCSWHWRRLRRDWHNGPDTWSASVYMALAKSCGWSHPKAEARAGIVGDFKITGVPNDRQPEDKHLLMSVKLEPVPEFVTKYGFKLHCTSRQFWRKKGFLC